MAVFLAVEHGACEIVVCKMIAKLLRIDIIPVSRNNGNETISLKESGDFLSKDIFRDIDSLNRFYKDYKKGKVSKKLRLEDVSIFVIMDIDGDRTSIGPFESKSMFHGSVFHKCIHPILNDPKMEEIFRKAGFEISEGRGKVESYRKAMDGVERIEEFCERFDGLKTDMPKMIKELMKHASDYQK